LTTLGPHVADYNQLTIKFYDGPSFVTLKGDPKVRPSALQVQFHHLRRLQHTNAISEVFTLHSQPPPASLEDPFVLFCPRLLMDLLGVLHKFAFVFRKPQGLPPVRSHDHAIPLLPGTAPVKVHPYRYPFSYKTEIEKTVQELLHDGLIQPNTSPFSSPIILVKKKDGSWRFCTDYMVLNFSLNWIFVQDTTNCW